MSRARIVGLLYLLYLLTNLNSQPHLCPGQDSDRAFFSFLFFFFGIILFAVLSALIFPSKH